MAAERGRNAGISIRTFQGKDHPGRGAGLFRGEPGRLSLGGAERRPSGALGLLWGQGRAGFHHHKEQAGREVLYFCDGPEPVLRNARQVPSFLGGDRQERKQMLFRLGIGKPDRLERAEAGENRE